MAALNHQADEMGEFLAHLYDGCDPDGWLTLFALDRSTGAHNVSWARVAEIDALTAAARERAHCCVWFGVATRAKRLPGGRRGTVQDCAQLPALWVDLDVVGPNHARDDLPPDLDAAHSLLGDHPQPPTVTVRTGGGLQAFWKLDEPIPAADGIDLLRRWGATWAELGRRRGWHVDSVFNVDRIMRLPGTTNTKGLT